ncbi:MAG: hypothetical protein R3C10_01910 [Pirellulales bacterium]
MLAVGGCALVAGAGEPDALRAVRWRLSTGGVDARTRSFDDQAFATDRPIRLVQYEAAEPSTGNSDRNSFGLGPDAFGRDAIEQNAFDPPPSRGGNFEFSLTPAPGIASNGGDTAAEPGMLALPDDIEALPPGSTFEELPPTARADGDDAPLPNLADELYEHGGSYLYCPEGDRLGWPARGESHYEYLRLPEWWQKPRPLTAFAEFLGADPIKQYPRLKWFGPGGDSWEPRLVGYGGYQMFAFAFEANHQRSDAIGHQLLLDLDLRLTGTERFHVQFRPIGKGNTGGSYYQFNDPAHYVDNSTGEPDRYWFEGELYSMLSSYLDPFAVRDVHFVGANFLVPAKRTADQRRRHRHARQQEHDHRR